MTGSIKLLLVEDNSEHAHLIRTTLRRSVHQHYDDCHARTAGEGTALLSEQDFDIILLDLSLPDSTPHETLETYTTKFPQLPIVVLTSLADESLVRIAMTSGAQDYIDKSLLRGDVVDRSIRYAIERKRVLGQVERKNRELQHFAYTLAHEVRSPLQIVRTALEEAQLAVADHQDESLVDFIGMGVRSSDHIAHIVSDLLAFSETDADTAPTQKVELSRVLREVIEQIQLQEGVGECEFYVEHPLPSVLGSAPQLRHVFQNLLINAMRYRSEKPPRVEISATTDDGRCKVSISDNGIGIAPEHHHRIFEFLYRVKADEHITGTGIGLGFCKQILERHEGAIHVESEPGAGSTFILDLPLFVD